MKTIIAGSRTIRDWRTVHHAVMESGFVITEVVSGGAPGVDRLGEQWAARAAVPVRQFLADWDRHGLSAGYIRNNEMAHYADALIAIWDGISAGTKNMIDQAQKRNLKVFIVNLKTDHCADCAPEFDCWSNPAKCCKP